MRACLCSFSSGVYVCVHAWLCFSTTKFILFDGTETESGNIILFRQNKKIKANIEIS